LRRPSDVYCSSAQRIEVAQQIIEDTLTKKKHSGSKIGYTTTPFTQQIRNKTTFPDLGRFLRWNSLKEIDNRELPKDKISRL
jgi:hypothetical protein